MPELRNICYTYQIRTGLASGSWLLAWDPHFPQQTIQQFLE